MSDGRGGRAIRVVLLVLLVAVPLFVSPVALPNFDAPKAAVLAAGVLAALAIALVRAVRSKETTKVPVPEGLVVVVLAAGAALLAYPRAPDATATVLALGLIGALGAAGILYARYLPGEAAVRFGFPAVLAAGAAAALAAFFGPWGAASTFGNPSFAAEFQAAALPLALPFLLAGGRARLFAGLAAAAIAAHLVTAKSRADWLGFAAGVAVAGAIHLLGRRRERRDLDAGRALPLALLLLAGIVALPFAIDALAERAGLPLFGRSDTVAIRRHIREATLEIALDHPGAGVGAGGFRAAYPEVRHPEEARLSLGREVTFPHHLPLAAFAEGGLFGLLTVLVLMGSVLYSAVRNGLSRPEDAAGAAAAAGAVAILVSSQFSAPLRHPGSALLFFFLAAFLATRRPRRFVTDLTGRYRRAVPVLVLFVAPAALAIALPKELIAGRLYQRAVEREIASGGGMDAETGNLLQASVDARPTPEALRQLAFYRTASGERDRAFGVLDDLFRISPHDEWGRIERARLLIEADRPAEAVPILDRLLESGLPERNIRLLAGIARLRSGAGGEGPRLLLEALREIPSEEVDRAAGYVARMLPPEHRDGLYAQVSLWPEEERALAVLRGFGDGPADYYRATIHARAGRLGEAMDALREARRRGAADPARLATDPRLDPLRRRADFHELIR